MKRLSAVLTAVVSLLLVGFIRSAVPPYTPDEYDVRPDEAGVGRHEQYTVELLGFHQAVRLVHERSYETIELETDHVFVLMEVRVTPHRQTLLPAVELRTPDGYSYDYLDPMGFPVLSTAFVGQTTTATYIFEVPEAKVEGSWVGFHGSRADGLQPVWPVLRFDVVDPEVHDEYNVSPLLVEPSR
ncbi:hypothetical protein LKO27_12630 [Tessaracoccus sp. OS52]|uniref:hypothetical protein n=1 Tax=Tessaracoccus sp. OS52 TaxID=2886691 RepID=UPI001D0FA4D7|nr:hypothetical protein [Tessaracoccus sp. OS52]MCC2594252.1 hypothetical protein [Tessaracoccus sp. OS52]